MAVDKNPRDGIDDNTKMPIKDVGGIDENTNTPIDYGQGFNYGGTTGPFTNVDPAQVLPLFNQTQTEEEKPPFLKVVVTGLNQREIVPVTEAEALGTFAERPAADIKKIQNQFIKAGYKDIKATGKLDTPEQVDNYLKAVRDAWSSYSNLVQINPNTDIINIGTFVDNAASQGSGGKPSTTTYESLYLTSEADAISYFNQLYLEYTGVAPTPKQAKEYYNQLNSQEKKNVQRQTTTTAAGVTRTTVLKGGVDEVDKEQLALSIIERVVTPEGLGQVSGQLGQNLKNIDQTLAAYNVKTDPATRREYLINSIKSKNGLNDVVSKIQNLSALQNPALAPYIQQGYKPQEVLGGYKQFKNSLTGLPDTPGLWDDPDMGWIATQQKLPDYNSFRTYVLDRPEADYYPEQRKQAASYALNILDMWGLR